jgi:ribonuclease-3
MPVLNMNLSQIIQGLKGLVSNGRHRFEGLEGAEAAIGHHFKDPLLLQTALTHPSCLNRPDVHQSNQRLEFLGDSVLGLILSEALYTAFPLEQEGYLTQAKASLAKGVFLCGLARELKLGEHLMLSPQALAEGTDQQDKALEDVLESIVGAVYLDAGYAETRELVLSWYGDFADHVTKAVEVSNPKGRLQECLQKTGNPSRPTYEVVGSRGSQHERTFTIEVSYEGRALGKGKGKNRKAAEAAAARAALKQLESKRGSRSKKKA